MTITPSEAFPTAGSSAGPAARDLTRILLLANDDGGELLAVPSPIVNETVLMVYYLVPGVAYGRYPVGRHGDHSDAVAVRVALRARLVELGEPTYRMVPNGDIHQLRLVTITPAGLTWLLNKRVPGVVAALNPIADESTLRRPADTGWTSASSWSGSSWSPR